MTCYVQYEIPASLVYSSYHLGEHGLQLPTPLALGFASALAVDGSACASCPFPPSPWRAGVRVPVDCARSSLQPYV